MSGGNSAVLRWVVALIAIAGTLLSLGLLASVLAPPLVSVAKVEVVEDPGAYPIGAVAEIELDEGWSTQPVSGDGQLIRSPDRELVVTMRPAMPEDRLEDQLEGRVLIETLSNGAELSHVSVGSETSALLRFPGAGEAILVTAVVADGVDPARYRAQLAELLLHVKPLG